jgi:hypothetical protein
MRSSFAVGGGGLLLKTPSHRRQALRRRAAVACGVIALALASGLVGSLIHPAGVLPSRPTTGPFSYFPSE